jgi:hypothetical protein
VEETVKMRRTEAKATTEFYTNQARDSIVLEGCCG